MAEDSESFMTNPFLELDASRFPGTRDSCVFSVGDEGADGDRLCFLRAMKDPAFAPKKRKRGGFSLSEVCQWPFAACSMKKKKKMDRVQSPAEESLETVRTCARDDAEAFLQAMRSAVPLTGKGRKIAPKNAGRPEREHREPSFEELLERRLEFALFHSDEYLEGKVAGLDDLVMNRLRQGKMAPEAHLDLHGLNASQAYEALRVFIRDCWFKDLRVILIVTGRGRNSLLGHAVLRQKLQTWLPQEPFSHVVLAFCTARPHDGGPGSVYVLLRRFRKKGRPHWDRMPLDPDLYE